MHKRYNITIALTIYINRGMLKLEDVEIFESLMLY